jgi:hypothetical protein|tara:strand:+ start:215 stop:445 length:231 start_codon:yes stop_codon:yes gene_type:complete
MKESKLIEMQNKVETLGKVAQKLMIEMQQITQLSVGTLETIKNMEGYEQAIEKLKEKMVAESGKAKEADASRKIIE